MTDQQSPETMAQIIQKHSMEIQIHHQKQSAFEVENNMKD